MTDNYFSASWILPINKPPIKNGVISISEGRITDLGLKDEINKKNILDYPNAVIIPGLCNAHTHLEYSFRPKKRRELDFVSWMIKLVKQSLKHEDEDFYWSSIFSAKELIKKGTTSLGNIVKNERSIEASIDSRLRGIDYLEVIGWQDSGDFVENTFDKLENLICLTSKTKFKAGLSPHSIYTLSPDLYKNALALAVDKKLPISFHIAESAAESELTYSSSGDIYGKLWDFIHFNRDKWVKPNSTPLKYLKDRSLLIEGSSCIHNVHLEENDFGILKEYNLKPVLCLASNSYLNVGLPAIDSFYKHGIEIAFGTDSLASNQSLDLFNEFILAKNNFPDLINPQEFLKTITINGAKSLGLDDVCGTLEIGKLADLAIFEIYEDISNDPYSFISLPPEKRMLKAVYVEGQKIFEDGQFEYLDEELINHEVQKRKLIPQ